MDGSTISAWRSPVEPAPPSMGVEALIPGNKQSGSHLGVIAQFHLYFDDLFPNSLGKPIVDWFH